jgi:hypothetical protein
MANRSLFNKAAVLSQCPAACSLSFIHTAADSHPTARLPYLLHKHSYNYLYVSLLLLHLYNLLISSKRRRYDASIWPYLPLAFVERDRLIPLSI